MIQVKDLFQFGTILTIFLIFTSCAKDDPIKCIENIKEDCVCTLQYDPVCGCNNKTYGNACDASCSGVEYTPGACPK